MKSIFKTAVGLAIFLSSSIVTSTCQGATPPPGKQFFGKVKSNEYVVTQEVDKAFTDWLTSRSNLEIGGDTTSSLLKGVAIGVPALNSYQPGDFTYAASGTGTNYYWRQDYMGTVFANRESVAIGDSAQARYPVAVAIGDQAIVGKLHTDSSNYYPVVMNMMVVTARTPVVENPVTTYTTNILYGAITNWYDAGQYERLPEPTAGWVKINSPYPIQESEPEIVGVTETVTYYAQKTEGALRDISYLTPEEYAYYNRGFSGGQGTVPLNQAYYGVAIGSRSYVFGYHGVALGHYSHVSRPWAMALGSEAHVYSEGAQGIGHDVDIATNAPYSLAVGAYGTVTPGMTNAIVVGVPQIKMKEGFMTVTKRPTAVKNNSINFAYNGNGIQDFFLDGVSLQERLASEVKVVGNTKEGVKPDEVDQAIRAIGNIPDNEEPLVFYSGDGGIYFFTKGYEDDSERHFGDISKIFINGKPLSEIIEGSSSHDADFAAYKTTVSNAAERAMAEVNDATNMTGVKAALTNFFNTIKQ